MLTFIPAKLDPGCNTSKPYSLQLYIYNQSCRRGNDTVSRDYYFLFFSTYLWNQWDLVIQNKFLQRDKLQYNVLRVIFIIYYLLLIIIIIIICLLESTWVSTLYLAAMRQATIVFHKSVSHCRMNRINGLVINFYSRR